jgi:1-acyl-sn-glycerol-3-phosphate acyltransferase
VDLVDSGLASQAVRIAAHVLLRAYLCLFHRFRASGEAQLKHLRGHLIVANHTSHLDALAIFSAFPLREIHRVRSVCARDYFFAHPFRRTIAFLLANIIPMGRDTFDGSAFAYCRRKFREGANIILFPEGTRSVGTAMQCFKPGVGLLALRHDLPVVPAFVRGAHRCWPKGAVFPRPGRIEVVLGRPVRYRGMPNRKASWRWIARDLEHRVGSLAAEPTQEHVDNEPIAPQCDQGGPSHGGKAERRHPHRPAARAYVRQDGRLRVPEPAFGQAADR